MSQHFSRRTFLAGISALGASCAGMAFGQTKPVRVLLRSSWQTVNIGDIAHTPGMLALLEKHLPEAEVTLWPNALSDEVAKLLTTRFPKLKLATKKDEQQAAIEKCDFCLHGSGPGLVGAAQLKQWQATGKPYGFGGVTLNDGELRDHRELLAGARFVYCRDTLSLAALKDSGIRGPVMEFGPDATFVLDLRNDEAASKFLESNKLEPRKFACFVPRLRYTPYWKERPDPKRWTPQEVAKREKENADFRETDHAKLREAISLWVRKTGQMALLCPEMTYQVPLIPELLFDKLPEDVKEKVVIKRDYWLTDEAASTYAQAAAVVSLEMHSPIIAIANGTPAIHVRQPTDTRKGQMWRDVGLSDWLFEVDDATGDAIGKRLIELYENRDATAATVAKAREYTIERGAKMMRSVAKSLS